MNVLSQILNVEFFCKSRGRQEIFEAKIESEPIEDFALSIKSNIEDQMEEDGWRYGECPKRRSLFCLGKNSEPRRTLSSA